MRHLVLVLGDQLDRRSAAFDGFDPEQDAVWMAEVEEEATHVWCHKLRIAGFFAAMRHFRDELQQRNIRVLYHELSRRRSDDRGPDFPTVLRKDVHNHRPSRLIVLQPGDYRVQESLQQQADELDIELEIRDDRHFYCGIDEFREWADGRSRLVLEDFYRHLRRKHRVLVGDDGEPAGGEWNFDQDNREHFDADGPGHIKAPRSFRPDDVTRSVIDMVHRRYDGHPGDCDNFDLPVTHREARALLRDFVRHRLAHFGTWQDAIWTGRPFLYHSRLSFALNLHLISPRDCVAAAVDAYESGDAPINSVEGFVRQILGWREFVRGIYWREMPGYIERNALRCGDVDVPQFFWDGDTDMACVRDAMQSVLRHGYAHHIQRLMVLGLFCQLAGVHPRKFHEWHMAMYADAVDWVSLPNTLGMSQYGDGGIVGTKPYCASGNYINRMSNCCANCRYDYREADGDDACPFTTLYWDFLDRHQRQFDSNNRMNYQLAGLKRKSDDDLAGIRTRAASLKHKVRYGERL